jgi:hypothetical protein
MRRAEQRALHERRKAAEAVADLIRRRGALAYAEAARLDSATLTQDYRVKLPWAMWPKEADSERYELYEIAEIDTECQYVVLERTGASYAERRRPIRKGARPHWNRFAVDWDCFTGVRRYGTNQRGVVIVHRDATEGTSTEDEDTDEEERQQQGLEARRAAHRAARLMGVARAADRDAAKLLQEEEHLGRAHTAADDALRQEDAEGTDDVPSDDSDDTRRDAAPDAALQEGAGSGGTQLARRRGTWSGKNWAREAWTGPVAAMEYAAAWREDPPERPPRSTAADAAQRRAHQQSLEGNREGNRRAATTAMRETARRGGGLWGAAADAEAMDDQRHAIARLAQAARRWQEREQPGQRRRAEPAVTHAVAAAADALQRKRPAADTVDAAARKRAMIDAAHIITATRANLELPGDNREARARQMLRRATGDPSALIGGRGQQGAEMLMETVLASLPDMSEPHREAPQAAGILGVPESEARTTVSEDATERSTTRRPSFSTAIWVGNLHAQGRAAQRPEGAIDRRVDRTTACGNPFLIAPNNERERNAACRAYAELIHGDTEGPNVRKLAAAYGLRVDPKFDRPETTQARDNALRQLERDVLTLHQGTSIRLMCHCAPKRCHAHAIASEIRRRLLTRGVDIHVDDGGWEGPPEPCMDADTYADHDDEDAEARTVDEAGTAAAHQHDPGTPSHNPTDTMSAPRAPPECWVSRLFNKLLEHKKHGRNQRAYEEFMAQMETEAVATAMSSAERATEEATSRAGAERERARAARAMEMRTANRRKTPEAAARMRAAVAKAATERALREREAAARGAGLTETARGATETATAEATAKGAEAPGTGVETKTTTAAATATRATTSEADAAEAMTTTAKIGRGTDNGSANNGDRGSTDTHGAAGDDDEQAHDSDGDARGDGGDADEIRAAQRATEDGGSTRGIKKRGQRGGKSEYKAHKAGQRKRNDKYGDKTT